MYELTLRLSGGVDGRLIVIRLNKMKIRAGYGCQSRVGDAWHA